MALATNNPRTIARLRELGYLPENVEKYNSFTRQRKDFCGCIDFVAPHATDGTVLFVQVCSDGTRAEHRKKMLAVMNGTDHNAQALKGWRNALKERLKVELWSWGKKGPRGKRKVWTLTREEVI